MGLCEAGRHVDRAVVSGESQSCVVETGEISGRGGLTCVGVSWERNVLLFNQGGGRRRRQHLPGLL